MTVDSSRRKSANVQLAPLESTELYQLLSEATEGSLTKSLQLINTLNKNDINNKSQKSGNTYLHVAVLVSFAYIPRVGSGFNSS